jgi:hypothetical protein
MMARACSGKYDVSTHAQTDRFASSNVEVIQQSQRVHGALPVRDGSRGISGAAVAARVWSDQRIFANQLFAAGVHPIFVAAASSMQKQERLSRSISLDEHLNAIEVYRFRFHGSGL